MSKSHWPFSVRMIYDRSDRTFEMDTTRQYVVDIEDHGGSWVPFGGPAVVIEAKDDTRTCLVALGLEQFTESFAEAVTRFGKLDLTYASSAETPEEKLEDRNRFLKHAIDHYPATLTELSRTLHRLLGEVQDASARISTMKRPV